MIDCDNSDVLLLSVLQIRLNVKYSLIQKIERRPEGEQGSKLKDPGMEA